MAKNVLIKNPSGGKIIFPTTETVESPTLKLNPLAADPSTPSIGTLQYADGTARAEGVWQYKSTGWSNVQGNTGIQGIQGNTGIQGIQGTTGILGINGTQGDTGIQGIQGNTGVGIQGATGIGGSGGGGGGISLIWRNDDTYAAIESTRFNQLSYDFTAGENQYVYSAIKVPTGYTSGKQISLKIKIASPTGSGNVLFTAVSTLINSSSTSLGDTTLQRTSTNTAQTISTADKEYEITLDISSATGQIGSTPTSIAAGNTILFSITRGTDTNTDVAYFLPSTVEVYIAS